MVWKLLILVFGVPFLAASFLGWLMGHRVLGEVGDVRVGLEDFLRKLMRGDGVEEALVFYRGRGGMMGKLRRGVSLKKFEVDEGIRRSQRAEDFGKVLMDYMVWRGGSEFGEALGWKLRVAKMVRVLPIFATLIAVAGSLTGRMPFVVGIAIVAVAWGGSALLAWSCLGVNRELARRAELFLTERRLLARVSDEEAVVGVVRALPWCELAPFDVVKRRWWGNR